VSPTQRTLEKLRDAGYLAQVVERWNPHAKVRNDLFGFIDVLAIRDGEILGVQATSRDNVSKRVSKIAEHPNVAAVRKAGIRIVVHGWSKMASGRYELREVDCS
jgi:carbonic anhydrase